jgi:predicted RNA-binding Zn-ribbon protein involved in translation (DUF1610 family)
MGLFNDLWIKYLNAHTKMREVRKFSRSMKTGFKCPKCKSSLFQIVSSKSIDPQYFCKKCGYEGLGKI